MNDIKLSFINKKFSVDGTTTICTIRCVLHVPYRWRDYLIPVSRKLLPEEVYVYNDCFMFEVTGKSYLMDDDVFDEQAGKYIAKTKAYKKAYTKASKLIGEISVLMNDDMAEMMSWYLSNTSNFEKEQKRYNDLVYGNKE